jgi:parvulin-like peptidyl-prolyl isomerase
MAKKTERAALKPVASIVKKRSIIVPVLIIVALIVVAALLYFFATQKEEGEIIATVNGEPIYEEDINAIYNQLPEQYREQLPREVILNQSIDKLLLLQEARRRGIEVTEEDVDEQLEKIKSQFGLDDEQLETVLANQSITLEEYKELVSEELLLQRVLEEAIISRVSVSDQEVIEYYDTHQDEFSAPAGGAIISHILVENQTTARDIVERLDDGESFDQLAREFSLDTASAEDGGYIGIITNESFVVPEFKTAALKLRPNQYTRTPVNSTFGWHVIYRAATDAEPLRRVRDPIREQLTLTKQKEAFQTLLATLRSEATIRYYTQEGVITEQQEENTLQSFAECVAEESTLYGTSWSPLFQEQQALFGDSFSHLVYVDCEAKPHLCAAANIQKYPTWVIGNERYGKLSLKELSEKTGCELND